MAWSWLLVPKSENRDSLNTCASTHKSQRTKNSHEETDVTLLPPTTIFYITRLEMRERERSQSKGHWNIVRGEVSPFLS